MINNIDKTRELQDNRFLLNKLDNIVEYVNELVYLKKINKFNIYDIDIIKLNNKICEHLLWIREDIKEHNSKYKHVIN
jgi:hypothetical protein